jgi:hypothetical protein
MKILIDQREKVYYRTPEDFQTDGLRYSMLESAIISTTEEELLLETLGYRPAPYMLRYDHKILINEQRGVYTIVCDEYTIPENSNRQVEEIRIPGELKPEFGILTFGQYPQNRINGCVFVDCPVAVVCSDFTPYVIKLSYGAVERYQKDIPDYVLDSLSETSSRHKAEVFHDHSLFNLYQKLSASRDNTESEQWVVHYCESMFDVVIENPKYGRGFLTKLSVIDILRKNFDNREMLTVYRQSERAVDKIVQRFEDLFTE